MQKDGCWMCHKKDGRLCVDHIHIKGFKYMEPEEKKKYVRGALCFICNTTLGKLERRKNARELLTRIVAYAAVFKLKGDV